MREVAAVPGRAQMVTGDSPRLHANLSMALVTLNHRTGTIVAAALETVVCLLCDPPRWGNLQPHVSAVRAEADGSYQWEFEEMTIVGVRLRPSYRVRLIKRGLTELVWEPMSSDGYWCAGTWRLTPLDARSTHLDVEVIFGAEIPIPAPFVQALRPAVQTIFARQIDELLSNLQKHFARRAP